MVKSLILIFTSVGLAVAGQLLLKVGMNRVDSHLTLNLNSFFTFFLSALTNSQVLLGLFLYFCSAIVWLIVLSRVELSFAYPLLGLSYVLVVLASKFILKEEVMPLRWVGSVIIFLGVFLVSRS